jgi:DNA (cytosine-5)-methyltransferase 1
MKFGSLFSGIGGFDLGFERAGWTCAWQVEIDDDCQSILQKHWPNVRRFGRIEDVDPNMLEHVDAVIGGFPCQDVSCANTRGHCLDGARSGLWREYARILAARKPRFAVIECTYHRWRRWVPRVRSDLWEIGYASLPIRMRASDFGAPHKRARVIIVADALGRALRLERWGCCGTHRKNTSQLAVVSEERLVSDANARRELESSRCVGEVGRRPCDEAWWTAEPDVARVVHGLPGRVDRSRRARERMLGNVIVPPLAGWVAARLMDVLKEEGAC